jgi:hypothetical protein
MQSGWRRCQRCEGFAFSGNGSGLCPAGGPHDYARSRDYVLEFAGTGPGQTGWRWCLRCEGLAFSGHSKGVCPAGGAHDGSQSGDYALHAAGTGAGQTGWRWCRRCQGLFFSGHGKGVCPAGGQHDDSQSGDYEIEQAGSAASASESEATRNLLVGFNYPFPWNTYGEYFGGGTPPGADPRLDDWIPNLKKNLHILKADLNIWHVRIFLLCNAWNYGTVSSGPPNRLTPPAKLHPKYTDHLKKMLDAFQCEDMIVIPSLIDCVAFWPLGRAQGTGGRADIPNDPSIRTTFLTQVLDDFLRTSASYRSSILAWEVINEPIWATSAVHASFLAMQKTHKPAAVLKADVSSSEMTRFIDEAVKKIHAAGFDSTVGHRYFDDLATLPTGKWRQFHYYPESVSLAGLGTVMLPYTDPNPLPDYATSKAFLGEFGCMLPGKGHGGAWPELNGADTKNVETAVHERLRLLNRKGYGLALVWPDEPPKRFPGPDPIKLSIPAQEGIKRFMKSP